MIDVALTFDVEFSIGGALTAPSKYQPLGQNYVWLRDTNNRSLGLGYVLHVLKEHDIKGIFFTETCNASYHGPHEMGSAVEFILSNKQDVQMHCHPCWMHYYKEHPLPPNDSCAGRSKSELHEIIGFSIETLHHWTGKQPIAIRTGSLRVDKEFYNVAAKFGIPLSSSIGIGITPPPSGLEIFSGVININGMHEIPVTTTQASVFGKTKNRSLQILSCSIGEIVAALEYAHKNSISPIVILSHPFEYVRSKDFRYEAYIKNNLVRQRLEGLCKFLARNTEKFRTVSASDMLENIDSYSTTNRAIKSSAPLTISRMIQNKANDTFLSTRITLANH